MSDPRAISPRVIERGKRWLRIYVAGTQSRDLFYPCCTRPDTAPRIATIQLLGTSRFPRDIFLNGQRTEIRNLTRIHGTVTGEIARADLVLPGENIVSLPIACDPREVRIVCHHRDDVGWGSQTGATIELADPFLAASARFLSRSLSHDPFGTGTASLTAWDRNQACVRLWSWYWTTGIVYEALAALVDSGGLRVDLTGIEEGFLARQSLTGENTRGSYFVRWDPDRRRPEGVRAWHAPNDAAYLGLHGLLVAHRRSGDAVWLDRSALLADWIWERGMNGDRLRVGWNAVDRRWDDAWHYIDAAWTPAFFQELAARTGEKRYTERAVALAHDTVARFATRGPFYLKIWRANGRHTRTVFARGMAWVLEGWVPLAVAGQDWLVPRIRALVRGLLDHQRPDGAWPYLLDRPQSGPCNKGTPAIACHIQRAAALLPEYADEIGHSVTKALVWCEDRMDLAPGSPAFGGIFASNDEGAIATVRGISVAVNYASAYYILTRKEREA